MTPIIAGVMLANASQSTTGVVVDAETFRLRYSVGKAYSPVYRTNPFVHTMRPSASTCQYTWAFVA